MIDLKEMSPIDLLKLHSQIIDELKHRGIAKTRNQPIAEYSKWLVRNKLKLNDVNNPNEKYDGYDTNGKKYLVRSRQIINNRLVQFSVIRNIEYKNFDYLVAVSFDTGFRITEAYLIPVDVLLDQLDYNEYQNGYLLKLSQFNLNDGRIKDIKDLLIY